MDKQMSLNTKQHIEQLKPTKNSFELRCFGGEGVFLFNSDTRVVAHLKIQ